jgi:hypothetical protein
LLLSPLGDGQPPSFEQFRIPSPNDDLCQVWLKLAQWFWRRSRKCKSLQKDGRTDGRTTNKMWSEKLTWAFGSGELKMTKTNRRCYFAQKFPTVSKCLNKWKGVWLHVIYHSNRDLLYHLIGYLFLKYHM